jgi:hypothetical protein
MTVRNSRGGAPQFRADTDVRHLPTRRLLVTGLNWFRYWRERPPLGSTQTFRLRAESGNPHDKYAVGVWVGEDQLGYLYSDDAEKFGALLRLHRRDIIVVGGLQDDETSIWLNGPRYKALKTFLETEARERKQRYLAQ